MQDLLDEGFRPAGTYEDASFTLRPEWSRREAVYAWVRSGRVVRVGVACGASGLGGRYESYNRWLAGRHKPDDAREQRAAAYVKAGLGERAEVWSKPVGGKAEALTLERTLRTRWQVFLDLDGMVRGGLFRRTMAAGSTSAPFREGAPSQRRASAAKPDTALSKNSRRNVDAKLPSVEDWVRRGFIDLELALTQLGLEPHSESGPGRRWRSSDGSWVCRLHPKVRHLCIGLPNSRRNEVAAMGWLRAQGDAAWFDVKAPGELKLVRRLLGLG